MPSAMAQFAKSNAVIEDKPQFWKQRPRLNMMCLQVVAFLMSAILAGVVVATINLASPLLCFWRFAINEIALPLAVFPCVMLNASRCSLPRYCTNPDAGFGRMLNSGSITATSLCCKAHLKATLCRHFLSFSSVE